MSNVAFLVVDRLRGAVALGRDFIDGGSTEIERVHLATVGRTFTLLESHEPLRAPAKLVRTVHDTGVSATYGALRGVTRAAAKVVDTAIVLATRTTS